MFNAPVFKETNILDKKLKDFFKLLKYKNLHVKELLLVKEKL